MGKDVTKQALAQAPGQKWTEQARHDHSHARDSKKWLDRPEAQLLRDAIQAGTCAGSREYSWRLRSSID